MPYTRDQVAAAVNAGADCIRDALDVGDRDTDLINLVVNAALTFLDQPEADFDAVVGANYEASAREVRGWWDW